MAHPRSSIPKATRYVAPIRRLNVTIPDDLDPVLREAALASLSEGDFIRCAIREKALRDKYDALDRKVEANRVAIEENRELLERVAAENCARVEKIMRHLGIT